MRQRILTVLLFASLMLPFSSSFAFQFTDTQGHSQTLAAYKGKRLLVNFWATWCPPCRAEIPDLIALHNQYHNNKFAVLGVAMDYDSAQQVADFVHKMHISYPIVLGDEKLASEVGQVEGLPTSYLFNPQGKIVAMQVGALSREDIEHYIDNHSTPIKTPVKTPVKK